MRTSRRRVPESSPLRLSPSVASEQALQEEDLRECLVAEVGRLVVGPPLVGLGRLRGSGPHGDAGLGGLPLEGAPRVELAARLLGGGPVLLRGGGGGGGGQVKPSRPARVEPAHLAARLGGRHRAELVLSTELVVVHAGLALVAAEETARPVGVEAALEAGAEREALLVGVALAGVLLLLLLWLLLLLMLLLLLLLLPLLVLLLVVLLVLLLVLLLLLILLLVALLLVLMSLGWLLGGALVAEGAARADAHHVAHVAHQFPLLREPVTHRARAGDDASPLS